MNNNILKHPKHRAVIKVSAPVGKAVAIACKNGAFPVALSQKAHRFIGFDGKHDYRKLVIFNQMRTGNTKIGKSGIKMPIAQRPS